MRITKSEVERILIQFKQEYGRYWICDHQKMKSPVLAEAVCEHLIEWGFARWEEGGFLILHAAAGRWQVQYDSTEPDE